VGLRIVPNKKRQGEKREASLREVGPVGGPGSRHWLHANDTHRETAVDKFGALAQKRKTYRGEGANRKNRREKDIPSESSSARKAQIDRERL